MVVYEGDSIDIRTRPSILFRCQNPTAQGRGDTKAVKWGRL